ncbi:MAG: Rossmann-like and DUF2520 domain-containing protein [Planctomycetota bacterium]
MRLAVVGPGRVGTALATLWVRRGAGDLLGFLGRSDASVAEALRVAAAGRALAAADLQEADVVLVTTPDGGLAAVVEGLADSGVSAGALWVHCSGLLDLEVLKSAQQAGAAIGALHPVCPIPDAATGLRDLPGQPAVLQGDAGVEPRLRALAERLGLEPLWLGAADRRRYHAACALAANGGTALFALAERLLVRPPAAGGCGMAAADARRVVAALLRTAVASAERVGPGTALSGPARRGESVVIAQHLDALAEDATARSAYRALSLAAVELAVASGALDAAAEHALRRLLDGPTS